MGLTLADVRTFLEWRARGACFERVLTLGRQTLLLTPADFRKLHLAVPAGYQRGSYPDGFFGEILGTREVMALDRSSFEGARLQHDLNDALPREHWGKFDAVIDGGTLEHVFNVPVALANCMRALKVGGRFFGANPANNLMGHGFYQFGPDLYYRAFSEENGFRVERLELQESRYPSVELGFTRDRYEVADPAAVHGRVELVGRRPAMLRVVAVKFADCEPFKVWPQQSDYVSRWTDADAGTETRRRGSRMRAVLRSTLPDAIWNRLVGWRHRRQASLGNRTFFRPR
jgi:SAM-dependent methyltransferase